MRDTTEGGPIYFLVTLVNSATGPETSTDKDEIIQISAMNIDNQDSPSGSMERIRRVKIKNATALDTADHLNTLAALFGRVFKSLA